MRRIFYVAGMTITLAIGTIYLASQSAAKKSAPEGNSTETMSIVELHKLIDMKNLPVESFEAY